MKFIKAKKFIYFSPPSLGKKEEREVIDTLRSGWITTGPKVKLFEKKVADFVNSRHAVATSSCTNALQAALAAIGITKGDEVITPVYTFISTAHVILYNRATPVFVDVNRSTFNIDAAQIRRRITSRTKAILVVHYGGQSCDMDPILKLAEKYKIRVIEDAAHAIGTEYKGKKVGSLGDITCFSFYATKNITTAEGGMAVTNNKRWAEAMRQYTMYGIDDSREIWNRYNKPRASWDYDVKSLGYKCNMTDISAALGLQQMKNINFFISRRGQNSFLYTQAFKDMPELTVPYVAPFTKSSWHLYPLLLNLTNLRIDRNRFITELRNRRVGCSVLFRPVHMHSYYQNTFGFRKGEFPVAENLFSRIVNLPVSPATSITNIRYVISAVKDIVAKYTKV